MTIQNQEESAGDKQYSAFIDEHILSLNQSLSNYFVSVIVFRAPGQGVTGFSWKLFLLALL